VRALFLRLFAAAAVFAAASRFAHAQPIGVLPPGPPECGAPTTTTFSSAVVVPTVDLAVVSSPIVVSGAGAYLWDVGVVTNLSHPRSGDLSVTLTSPAGTVITLTSGNGGANADVFDGTVWDDQANPAGQVPYVDNDGIVTDHTYAAGVTASPLAPEEGLGAFAGEDPNGVWTLRVGDGVAGQSGALSGWSLSITTLPSRPTVLAHLSPSNPAVVPILDNATAISTIDVPTGIGTRICDLSLQASIQHAASADLDVTLTSPAGTVVTLTTDNGGSFANVFNGTLWDDRANPGGQIPYASNDGLVTDCAYANGVVESALVPEEPLSAIRGESPSGTWTLRVRDDSAGSTGTLSGWMLHITTCSCAASFAAAPLRVDEHVAGTTSNLNGVLDPDEIVSVEPSWSNAGGTPFTLVTYASNFVGPAGPTYTLYDAGAGYGTVPPLSTGNCWDATGDCYRVKVSGTRPAVHWDASFDEITAPIALTEAIPYYKTWILHVGGSFGDVPPTNIYYRYIETLLHAGVTGGGTCGGFCPQAFVQRKQMAAFLLKAKEGAAYVPPPATGIFSDVLISDPFAPWIEELYRRGIAAGCNASPLRYCPSSLVKRQQMPVFLLKTLLGSSYVPPAANGIYGDVPASSPFAPWIEDVTARGIAAGCGNGLFCPTTSNNRAQMAVFLVKTFGLMLYGP
jgi:subtilisin-like proprotein convertase family protein